MRIVTADEEQQDVWIDLRNRLWPGDLASHQQDVAGILSAPSEIAFLLIDDLGKGYGFIEGKYYQTKNHRYGHVEGWFVEPSLRGKGFGRKLLDKLEHWFLHHSIERFYSDTIEKEYPLSKLAHIENGYEQIYQLSVFLKKAHNKTS